jgi:hypothetical protein
MPAPFIAAFLGAMAMSAVGFYFLSAARGRRPIWLRTTIVVVLLSYAMLMAVYVCIGVAEGWVTENMVTGCVAGTIAPLLCGFADYALAGRFWIVFGLSMTSVFLIMSASLWLGPRLLTREG